MSSTTILLPTSLEVPQGFWQPYPDGGPSNTDSLKDGNLSTGWRVATNFNDSVTFVTMTNATGVIPATAQIRSVYVRNTVTVDNQSTGLYFALRTSSTGNLSAASFVATNNTQQAYDGQHFAVNFLTGKPWTLADLDALQVYYYAPNLPNFVAVLETQIVVEWNSAPVTTVTAPTGTITNTSQPDVDFTYSDSDNDPKERHWLKVFSSSQYGIVGFNPETSTATYDSGEVRNSDTSIDSPVSLGNGTYRYYVKTADAGSNGRYSNWSFSTVTIALDPVAQPSISYTPDVDNYRVILNLQGRQNMLSGADADMEGLDFSWYSIQVVNAITPSPVNTWSSHGSFGLRMTSSAAGTMISSTGGVSGNKKRIAVVPSKVYTAMAIVRAATISRSTSIALYWFKSDGTASSTPFSTVASSNTSTSSNTQLQGNVTAPADAAFVELRWSVASVTSGESHYLDQALIAPQMSVPTWTRGGLLAGQKFYIERSTDGTTWIPARILVAQGNSYVPIEQATIPTSQQLVAYDYEAPRGTAVQYRARSYSTTSDPYTAYSSYDTTTSYTFPLSGDLWFLKNPYRPDLSFVGYMLGPNWKITSHENAAFYNVISRDREVKISDVVMGDRFGLTALIDSAIDRDKLLALRKAQNTILIQAPDGRQWWMNFDTDIEQNEIVLGQTTDISMNFVEADAVPS